MINITKLSYEVANDLAIVGQSVREMFWEMADIAAQVRSQSRQRRILGQLADYEQHLYRQLGCDGYALLTDGASVVRTPQIDAVLNEISQYSALRRQRAGSLSRSPGDVRTALSSRRLARIVGSGDWQIHTVAVAHGSPWIGGNLTGDMPIGACLAVQRDQTLHSFTWDWRLIEGDLLVVIAPPTYFSSWDQWIAHGSTDRPDARGSYSPGEREPEG